MLNQWATRPAPRPVTATVNGRHLTYSVPRMTLKRGAR